MALGKFFGRTSSQKSKLPKAIMGGSLTQPVRNDIQAPNFELMDGVKQTPAAPRPGFDPYNSGAFDQRQTWRRISRR